MPLKGILNNSAEAINKVRLMKVQKQQPRIILVYHGVQPGHPLCVAPEEFHKQMLYISKFYSVTTLDRIIEEPEIYSDKPMVSVTFDDAYLNFLENVFPICESLRIPTTVFVPTRYLGRKSEWDRMKYPHNLMSVLNMSDIRFLVGRGVSIGSHTQSHMKLKGLSQSELITEIVDSKKILETSLGLKIDSFSYPYGERSVYDREAVEVVRCAGYSIAVTSRFGRYNSIRNRYELKRITVYPSDSYQIFIGKLTGWFDWIGAKESVAYYMKRCLGWE